MVIETLNVKRFNRLSPSRYTAVKNCLLREVWSASGNDPLLPASPTAELGSVIHQLLEAAGRGHLKSGGSLKVSSTWDELISQAEKKMALSSLRRHQVPLNKSIPDFEVRKLRACHKATEIAHDAFLLQGDVPKQSSEPTGFELWVESRDGLIGGYIDRATMTKDGVVLSDYKSGAILSFSPGEGFGEMKQAYKEQLELYAVLYQLKYGDWPIRLEVVPLQGTPVEVFFDFKESERILEEASKIFHIINQRIVEVENGDAEVSSLASPNVLYCRHCLFRPACHAYWNARQLEPQEKWPADVKGFLKETTRLHNRKVCIRITDGDLSSTTSITVRNLTDSADRHPFFQHISTGSRVEIYGLRHDYHSGDYTETQNTVIYSEN